MKALILAGALASTLAHETAETVEIEKPEIDPDIPDRICVERDSRHYANVGSMLGIRIDGVETENVVEYCISKGWVRVGRMVNGKLARTLGGRGRPITDDRSGVTVEPYWKVQPSRQIRRQLRRLGS